MADSGATAKVVRIYTAPKAHNYTIAIHAAKGHMMAV